MTIVRRTANGKDIFPSLFEDFIDRSFLGWKDHIRSGGNTTVPAINIKETPENYEVHMAAPGMDKNDLKVELDGNSLTVSAEKTVEDQENGGSRYIGKEFSYESFQRTITLHKDLVDTENIKAKYEAGVLQLVISKKVDSKQDKPREITIS